MSKQFYVYLLPPDVELLISDLKARMNVVLIKPFSLEPSPVLAESCLCDGGLQLRSAVSRVDCFMASSRQADFKMRAVPNQSHWSVEIQSEVIEFHGCEFDGAVLLRGRFYFQNDFLKDGVLFPKKKEFLSWADGIFRLSKRELHYSARLNAYVGEHALSWRKQGGRFASIVTPAKGPLYESDEDL